MHTSTVTFYFNTWKTPKIVIQLWLLMWMLYLLKHLRAERDVSVPLDEYSKCCLHLITQVLKKLKSTVKKYQP